jgi:hypothetical protein
MLSTMQGHSATSGEAPADEGGNAEHTLRDARFLVCLLLAGCLLLLPRLGDRLLWQDEAETALLAESVLRNGVPTAYDGRNLISADGQREFGDDYRWWWTPWLQHYAAAASFAVLGASTVSARLPFVLAGLLCLWATHALALRVNGDRVAARLAALGLLTSVPFLLHMRQCRYYAFAALFSVLVLHQGLGVRDGRPWARLGLVLAATGLLHSHYVFAAVLGAAMLAYACLPGTPHETRVQLAQAWGVAGLLFLPFGIRFAAQAGDTALSNWIGGWHSLGLALDHVNFFVLPLLLVPGLIWIAWTRAESSSLARWGLVAFAMLVTVPAMTFLMPDFFFRYYLPLVPLGAVLQGVALAPLWRWNRGATLALAIVLFGTDLVPRALPRAELPSDVRYTLTGDEQPAKVVGEWARFIPLAAYVYELTHDVEGPLEAVLALLERHGVPSDTVIATYGEHTLQFYTSMRVIGGLSREDPRPHLDAEWLLIRSHDYTGGDVPLARTLAREVDWTRYERVPLEAQDLPFENRPDPIYHKYRTVTEGLKTVRLFRRKPG